MAYYIDKKYDSLNRLKNWDGDTQKLIKERLEKETGSELHFNFLSSKEGDLLRTITDCLICQPADGRYVKIAEIIDNSLSGKRKGVRYKNNPWKDEFYKQGLKDFAAAYENNYKTNNLTPERAEKLTYEIFNTSNAFLKKFLRQVLTDSIYIYYSHPISWNKIGFPGPAYPEGYPYVECLKKEEWEPDYLENP